MSDYIQFKTKDGDTFLIEIDGSLPDDSDDEQPEIVHQGFTDGR